MNALTEKLHDCRLLCLAIVLSCSQARAAELDVGKLIADPANLVFSEDFSDASSVDRFIFASPEHWKRVSIGGKFALEHTDAGTSYKPPHRSPHNIALIKSLVCRSFVLDYQAQQNGKEYGHRDACVFFNFVDPTHYYYAHIATKRDDHAHQVFIVNNAPRVKITGKGTDGFDWGDTNSWHRIRVVRDGESGRISIYVDDMTQPIMESHDKTHSWGAVGFGSFDDTGRVTDIRLYASESREASIGF